MFNRTSKYLYKIIYDPILSFSFLEEYNITFINLYLGDISTIDYKSNTSKILMLIKIEEFASSEFHEFYSLLKEHPLFLDYYIIDESHLIIIFEVKTKEDEFIIDCFKKGKYSLFTKAYKSNYTPSQHIGSVYNVITKNPYLKRKLEVDLDVVLENIAELDSIPNELEESYLSLILNETYET
jgi:hypothetical protein